MTNNFCNYDYNLQQASLKVSDESPWQLSIEVLMEEPMRHSLDRAVNLLAWLIQYLLDHSPHFDK